MREIQLAAKIMVLDANELNNEVDRILIDKAKEAVNLSYSPYSKFKVGCALYLSNGEYVLGANQENASYPICLCAEGVTLSTAKTLYPEASILKMAIVVPSVDSPVSPCGLCRQSIKEYENRQESNIEIFLIGREEIYHFKGISTILPLAFDGTKLSL
ncbi:MAG: cytidine deaminase [Bacteroidetes bacterium]|nr:cytidine deaminase [Bacteroidota bacterium]